MDRLSLLSLGSINADFQVRVDEPPGHRETLLAHGLCRLSGGKASNIAYLAARFGHRSILLGRLSGEEETPPWQFNPMSGRWMADHTCLQRHIGSAVAYDAWQLYLATGDETLLSSHGDNQRSVPVQHAAGRSLLEPGQSLLMPCRVGV